MPRNTSQEQIDPMKKVTSHDAAATVNKDNPSTSFQKKSGHNNKVKSLAGDAGSRMADFLSKIREGTNEESLQVMPSRSEAQDYTLRNKKPQGMSRNTSQEQNNLMKKVTSHDTAAAMNKDEPGTSFQKHSGHNNNVKSLSGDSSIYLADFLRKVREGTNEESLHVMPSRLEAGVEFQTNNHHVEYEVQGHSNMDAWTAEEIFGSAVFDRTGDGDKDSEDDDDAMTYDHVEDGENGDDLNEEVELENDLTIDEGQQGSNSMEKKKKTRGPTMMHAVHTREQRECIILNRFGQPIGPDDKTLNEFSSFLGTIAHNYEFAPLVISTWCRMPSKERMWQYVLAKNG
ncbi:unnamed protein product [Cuscuta europaea]|uniref:Uncharacterized protein n=1 Tax=Cuscuta europaea TaxID=41803 RepID=A0A9P0ZIR2_CUSEU|nr:unnamed protein product [Cuscuta europaea]